jgi:ABC-type dipeptide/oligopeptide/nickel transport system permease component
MGRYLAGRIVAMVPVLLLVSVFVFLMIRLIPGDPVRVMLAESGASAERIESVRAQLGLDDPLPVQYGRFMRQMLTGEARSIRTQRPVVQEYWVLFPSTLELAVTALVLAALMGLGLGIVAAVSQHGWLDSLTMGISFLGVSVPNFWLALILIYVFAQQLAWLPATGGGDVRHLILPALVLAVQQTALIARLVRAHMVEALQEDYVKTARAKGLRERSVIWGHALRNALLPVVTLLGLNFGYLLSGAVIIETVFARPGTGRMIVDGILNKDFPVVQGAVLITATIYLLVNLLTDVSYALIDPRIRR